MTTFPNDHKLRLVIRKTIKDHGVFHRSGYLIRMRGSGIGELFAAIQAAGYSVTDRVSDLIDEEIGRRVRERMQ